MKANQKLFTQKLFTKVYLVIYFVLLNIFTNYYSFSSNFLTPCKIAINRSKINLLDYDMINSSFEKTRSLFLSHTPAFITSLLNRYSLSLSPFLYLPAFNELSTLEGHTSNVEAVAISSNASFALTASKDKSVILWNIANKSNPIQLSTINHTNSITSLAINSNASMVLTGSDDNKAILWDISNKFSPSKLTSLKGHKDHVTSVALNSDSSIALTGSRDGTAILWNIVTKNWLGNHSPKILATLKSSAEVIYSVAINADTSLALTGSTDNTAILWDISSKSSSPYCQLSTLKGHTNSVLSVAFSSNSNLALTGSMDRNAILWDISNRSNPIQLSTLKGHKNWVSSVSISSDSFIALTGSYDRTAILWNITNRSNPKILATLKHANSAITSVALCSNAPLALTGGVNHTAILWDIDIMSWASDLDICQLQLLIKLGSLKEYNNQLNNLDYSKVFDSLREDIKSKIMKWITKLQSDAVDKKNIDSLDFINSPFNKAETLEKTLPTRSYNFNYLLFNKYLSSLSIFQNLFSLARLPNEDDSVMGAALIVDSSLIVDNSLDDFSNWLEIAKTNSSQPASFLNNLSLPQIQLLIKLGNLKEYNEELDINDYGKIFNSLSKDIKSKVLQWLKTLPEGRQIIQRRLDKEKRERDLREKKRLQELEAKRLKAERDLQEKQAQLFMAAEIARKKRLEKEELDSFDFLNASFLQIQALLKSYSHNTLMNYFIEKYKSSISDFIVIPQKISTLKGGTNTERQSSLILSNDNTKALTGSWDNTAILWNIYNPINPKIISVLKGHMGIVTSVALNRDNTRALIGSSDCTAILWDINNPTSPKILSTLKGHTDFICSVVLSNDNNKALTGSWDCTAKLWDISNPSTLQELATLKGHTGYVRSVVLSNDNTMVLTGSDDKTAMLWNISNPVNPKLISILNHMESVSSIALNSDNTMALTGSRDHTPKLWNIANPNYPKLFSTLEGHSKSVTSVAISSDNTRVLTGSYDRTAKLWNISNPSSPKLISTLNVNTERIAINNDNTMVLTSSMEIWDITNNPTLSKLDIFKIQLLAKLSSLKEYNYELNRQDYFNVFNTLDDSIKIQILQGIKALPDGEVVRKHRNMRLRDLEERQLKAEKLELERKKLEKEKLDSLDLINSSLEKIQALEKSISPSPSLVNSLLAKYYSCLSPFIDAPIPTKLANLKGHTNYVYSVAISNNAAIALTGSLDHTAILWNITNPISPKILATLKGHTSCVYSVAISSDNTRALTGSGDCMAILWDISNPILPKIFATLKGHISSIGSVAISNDNTKAMTGSSDQTAMLWDISNPISPKILAILEGHASNIHSVAISNDNTWALTGSEIAILWDISSPARPQILSTLKGHTKEVASITLSNDNTRALTGSWDKTAILWDISNPSNPVILATLDKHESAVSMISINGDNTRVLTSSWTDSKLWDIANHDSPKLLATLQHAHTLHYSAALSNKGTLALISAYDNFKFDVENNNHTPIIWGIGSPVNLNISQIQLLTKLGNLKEYSDELQNLDYSNVFNTLDKALKAKVLQWIKTLPDGEMIKKRKEKEDHDRELELLQSMPIISNVDIDSGTNPSNLKSVQKMAIISNIVVNKQSLNDSNNDNNNILKNIKLIEYDSDFNVAQSLEASLSVADKAFLKKSIHQKYRNLIDKILGTKSYILKHNGSISAVSLNSDAKLALASFDNNAALWNVQNISAPSLISILKGHSDKITAAVISANNKFVLTGSNDMSFRLWNLQNTTQSKSFVSPSAFAASTLWNLQDLTNFTLKNNTDGVTSAIIDSNNKFILTGSDNISFKFNNTQNSAQLFVSSNAITSVALKNDSRAALIGYADNTAKLWSLGDVPRDIANLESHFGSIRSVAFSSDGQFAILGSDDYNGSIWDLSGTPNRLSIIVGHQNSILATAFSNDIKFALTGSADNTAILWNIEDKTNPIATCVLTGHTGAVTSVAFSLDDKYVITGSADNTIRFWYIENLDFPLEVHRLTDHTGPVTSLAFKSRYLISGSTDNTARIWQLSSNTSNIFRAIANLSLVQLSLFIKLSKISDMDLSKVRHLTTSLAYGAIIDSLEPELKNKVQEFVKTIPINNLMGVDNSRETISLANNSNFWT